MAKEYKITATIKAEITVQAVNVTEALSKARLIAEEIDGKLRDFDVLYIQKGDKTFTYDWGVHAFRENI